MLLSRPRLTDTFQELERLQNQFHHLMGNSCRQDGFPPINVWIGEDSAVLSAEVPGVAPQEIDISVVNDTVTLRGNRGSQELQENESLNRKERLFGQFSRGVQLPFNIDVQKVEATFKNGVLYVTLPRTEQDKPRKITVRTE